MGDIDSLFFDVLAALPGVDEQMLTNVAGTLNVDVPGEVVNKRQLVRLVQDYLYGNEFTALNQEVAEEALRNVLTMINPPPAEPVGHTPNVANVLDAPVELGDDAAMHRPPSPPQRYSSPCP